MIRPISPRLARSRRSLALSLTLAGFVTPSLLTGAAWAQSSTPPAASSSNPVAPAPKKDTPAKPPAEDSEVKMGREGHEEMLRSGLKLVKDPKLVARVEVIGKKLATVANQTPMSVGYGADKLVPYDYHFFIVDDPDVNAFALPGGYIYINKGLLNYVQSDDELAGVIGHEITHAAHHHVDRLQKEQNKLTGQMALGMLFTFLAHVPTADAFNLIQGFQLMALQKVNGFGQSAEKDADHGGVILTEKAGYNPVGMLTFMERLERDQRMRPDVELGIYRTHPPEKERVANITKQIGEAGLPIRRRAVTNMLKVQVRSVALNTAAPVVATTTGTAARPAASDAPPVAPVPAAPVEPLYKASEVVLDGTVLYRTPSAERAKQAASLLDTLLDKDVQLFDVTRKGTQVRVRGEVVFDFTAEDLTLPGSAATPEAAAEAAYKSLRNMLYKQFLITEY